MCIIPRLWSGQQPVSARLEHAQPLSSSAHLDLMYVCLIHSQSSADVSVAAVAVVSQALVSLIPFRENKTQGKDAAKELGEYYHAAKVKNTKRMRQRPSLHWINLDQQI